MQKKNDIVQIHNNFEKIFLKNCHETVLDHIVFYFVLFCVRFLSMLAFRFSIVFPLLFMSLSEETCNLFLSRDSPVENHCTSVCIRERREPIQERRCIAKQWKPQWCDAPSCQQNFRNLWLCRRHPLKNENLDMQAHNSSVLLSHWPKSSHTLTNHSHCYPSSAQSNCKCS